MKDEYIIINKTAIQKRIEELEKAILLCKPEQQLIKDFLEQELFIRREILSQSTTLIPVVEKAIDKGYDFAKQSLYRSDGSLQPKIKEYIENLKLDI